MLVQMGNVKDVLQEEGHSKMYSMKQAGAALPPLHCGFMGEYIVI